MDNFHLSLHALNLLYDWTFLIKFFDCLFEDFARRVRLALNNNPLASPCQGYSYR